MSLQIGDWVFQSNCPTKILSRISINSFSGETTLIDFPNWGVSSKAELLTIEHLYWWLKRCENNNKTHRIHKFLLREGVMWVLNRKLSLPNGTKIVPQPTRVEQINRAVQVDMMARADVDYILAV